LTESDQAFHNRVEIIVRKVIEEHAYFRWSLLELKAVALDGLDGN
jgi:hypothetical protein